MHIHTNKAIEYIATHKNLEIIQNKSHQLHTYLIGGF